MKSFMRYQNSILLFFFNCSLKYIYTKLNNYTIFSNWRFKLFISILKNLKYIYNKNFILIQFFLSLNSISNLLLMID